MAQVVVIERADGGITVLRRFSVAPTVAEMVAQWQIQADPEWLPIGNVRLIDDSTLPPRRFRNAWRWQGGAGGSVQPHVATARIIRAAELAPRRLAALKRLVGAIVAADVDGDAERADRVRQRRAALLALDAATALSAVPLADLGDFVPAEIADAEAESNV